MSNKPFVYQDPFPLKKDDTEYYLLSSDYVSVAEFAGQEVLKVDPQALTLLAQHAFHDASFMLRPAHQQQVADILNDPEASENDKYVALQFLRNSDIAAKGILPTCQDTGTAIIMGKKGQRVWTGGGDEAALAQGVYNTYIQDNLRYSQNAPLDMYKEVNTGTNLPAQIDLYATDGDEYKFLCIAKGGGSANKTYLYQETKALITPAKLKNYLVEKMRTLGTAACPPYHIAFVIGGTSAEATLKTVKLASTKYYDGLPTEGNEHGQAFRDVQLEQELLLEAQNLGLGAQFGGKYFAHDIRVIRLPLAPAGGVRATIVDMAKYAQALLAGNLAGSEGMHSLFATDDPDSRVGYAWFTTRVRGREIVWHDGQSGGFAAMMAFDRQRQTAVVILSDTAWPVIGPAIKLLLAATPDEQEARNERN